MLKKLLLALVYLAALPLTSKEAVNAVGPDAALERLIQGNARYIDDKRIHCNSNQELRESMLASQAPFAVILGCSDSRVSPEIVFDQNLGDLFVVRVAGNVLGAVELDSIEYAVLHLQSSVIVVLGHEGCGAVKAVLAKQKQEIEAIYGMIEPAALKAEGMPGNTVENAVKLNVLNMVESAKKSELIGKFIQEGKVRVVGAYYNLKTGKVDILNN